MMQFIRQLLTESDNATGDLARVMAALSGMTFLGLSIWAYGWRGQPFDPQAFGIGLGSMLAAFGAAVMLKDREK